MNLKLHSPINHVKGVGAKYLQIFQKNGISTVLDLLVHFPLHYIDFSKPAAQIQIGKKSLYFIEIIGWNLSRLYGRRLSILRVKARLGQQPVFIVFFNKPYLADFFKTNKNAYIYGQFETRNNTWQANTPLVFNSTDVSPQQVVPLYEKISTIKSGILKKLIKTALDDLEDDFECLPVMSLEKYSFSSIAAALKSIHIPLKYIPGEIHRLKKRFIYSEFLFFQLELQYIRNFFRRVRRIHHYTITPGVKAVVKQNLDFELTPDQKTACAEMVNDLQGEYTMQRLLQGDVGSGKTIVAFIALLLAKESGYQGAFLAPTEILASQHFTNAKKFFKSAKIQLLTGSTPVNKRKEILKGLKEGIIDIIFGTHALLTEAVRFHNLSMIVIDEQHRFGVSQRAALYYKGKSVDLLVTTATPIPRTMLLSLYNDLSLSTIKTKPQGRLPIITKIIAAERRDEFYPWLKKKVEKGEKAYIILPLIEKSDFFSELKDIETESLYFKQVFKDIPIGIVTGRTPALEKDATLDALARGDIRALVATTVIEVGIDVKDATIIVIENADRYGLSQLHQLRGRVGRGPNQSYCYLFPSPNITESGKKRLKTIAGTTDGFKIAETDLKMRGGGIITGLDQSGYLDFKIGNIRDDHEIFKQAQADASLILEDESLQNGYITNLLEEVRIKLRDINFS
ncbi:MAG: ATP-dependent DNA helicase RecG [Candidatus Aminicenantes bacterium]|nr:MAG: ATP-dependent DNA helicase RecG [Candidatus Aminicenantes bacterium]